MGDGSILEQLGGSRFQSRIGARDFNYPDGGLSFSIPSKRAANARVNRVVIRPNGSAYTITFLRFTREVARVVDVAAEQLEATIIRHITL